MKNLDIIIKDAPIVNSSEVEIKTIKRFITMNKNNKQELFK